MLSLKKLNDMRPIIFSLMASICINVACSKKEVETPQELMQYVANPENGLVKVTTEGDVTIEVFYRPHDIILQQRLDGVKVSQQRIDSIKTDILEYAYFAMKLKKADRSIVNAYANSDNFELASNYVSFQIGKDIRLIVDSDTIPVFDFISSQSFEASNSTDVLFVFKKNIIDINGSCVFQFDDNFFGSGLNRFEFNIADIKSIPSLSNKSNSL
jgi:hypothetical protein